MYENEKYKIISVSGNGVDYLFVFFWCVTGKTNSIEETIGLESTVPETTVTEKTEGITPVETIAEIGNQEISVAIYPYLPDVELFEKVMHQQWEKLEPNVTLNIERWDSYTGASECDVLLYDALVLTYLAENGYIQPISMEEIDNLEGIIPFAIEGSTYNGACYGIPYLLCGDILIYYKEDVVTSEIDSIPQLYAEVLERRKIDEKTGVVVYTEIDNPYHYLDAFVDVTGEYTTYEHQPDCTNLNQQALQHVRELEAMAVEFPDVDLQDLRTGEMFCEGAGFAFYGVSENMRYMEDILEDVEIKTISFSEEENIPMLYVDVASVASHVTDQEKLALCKKVINMVAGEEFLKELLYESEVQQYMLPARYNTYFLMEEKYPMYRWLYEIATDERNKALLFGEGFYEFIKTFRETVD